MVWDDMGGFKMDQVQAELYESTDNHMIHVYNFWKHVV